MNSNFKNATYNAISFIFPVAIGLITTPYIVHKLTTEIYGIYVLATSLMGLMTFLDLGFGQGIIKFVSHYEAKGDYNRINDIINTTLVINLIMGIIGGAIIFLFADIFAIKLFNVNEKHRELAILSFKIVSVGFVLNLVSSTFSNIPRALQRYDISVRIQNTIWFLSVMSSVCLLYLGYGLNEMLFFYIVFQFLGIFLYFRYSKNLLPRLSIYPNFKKDIFNEVFSFSIFTAINSITGNIVFRVDKMIIAHYLGTSAVTYYQIPFMLSQMANGFVSSVIQFLFPAVSSLNSKNDKENLKRLYLKTTRYVIALSLIIFSGLVIFGKPFLVIWIGKDIANISYPIMIIISLVFFFNSISNVGFYYYNGLGRANINMISSFIGAFSYLLASLILIPMFDLIGASISFIFILIPYPVYIYILNKILDFPHRDYLFIISKSIVVLLFGYVSYIFLKNIDAGSLNIGNILIYISAFIVSIILVFLLKFIGIDDYIEVRKRIVDI